MIGTGEQFHYLTAVLVVLLVKIAGPVIIYHDVCCKARSYLHRICEWVRANAEGPARGNPAVEQVQQASGFVLQSTFMLPEMHPHLDNIQCQVEQPRHHAECKLLPM